MKILWFKVEDGPADEVEVNYAENIKQLKQEIIQQHPRMFGEDQEAGVWHLYKSAEAKEPEDSGDSLDVLGDAGKTSRTALILKSISPTTTAPSGFFVLMVGNQSNTGEFNRIQDLKRTGSAASLSNQNLYSRKRSNGSGCGGL